MYIVAVF